jgi:predicted pyridoxine 5'-phosphate oxidase superfamily flavin-nucleotide-binding protein
MFKKPTRRFDIDTNEPKMQTATLKSLFGYKSWANAELFDLLGTLQAQHPQVCLSFVDVFVQKGFKLLGTAREVRAGNAEFSTWAKPLLAMVGQRFTIQSVLVVHVKSVAAIVAPSYRFYPDDTTEASQVASAMRAYKVQAVEKEKP